jgi:hypothetical protein
VVYRLSPPTGQRPEEILNWARAEFGKVEENLQIFDFVIFKTLTAEPKILKEGLTVLADGTVWDPGSGAGLYTYYGSSWHKLG